MKKHPLPLMLILAAGIASILPTLSARAADINATWSFPTNGSWDDATKWSSNPLFPNNGASTFNATIGAPGGPYAVTLGVDITIENLNLTSPGATLAHVGGTLEINGALTLQAGTYSVQGGAIKGTTITESGGALVFTNNGNNRLDGATLNGDLNLNQAGGAVVRLQNGAGFTGNANLGTPDGSQSILAYEQTSTLSGATINMDGIGAANYLNIEGTHTLTVGPTGKIRGQGSVGNQFFVGGTNALINQGLISADLDAGTLTLTSGGGSFTNEGTVEAINGATLSIQAINWSNGPAGMIRATGGSTLNFSGSYSNSGAVSLTDSTLNLQGTFTVGALGLGGFSRNAASVVNIQGDLDNTGATLALNAATGDWNLAGGRIIGGNITQSGGARLLFTITPAGISGDIFMLLRRNERAQLGSRPRPVPEIC
ncbi:MAG: hypothetical protein ABIZ56_12590 [Chthoniobacteraceae bacterium]